MSEISNFDRAMIFLVLDKLAKEQEEPLRKLCEELNKQKEQKEKEKQNEK